MMKDEIEGLKILLKQAESENASLRSKYEATCEEANRLKDAQKALENTVNKYVLPLWYCEDRLRLILFLPS